MLYFVLNNSPYYGGGVEQTIKNILEYIDLEKEDMTLICNDINKPRYFYYKGIKCINFSIPQRNILDKIFLYSQLKYSYEIYKYLKKYTKTTDIVNIHGFEYGFFPTIFQENIKSKLFVTVHGSYYLHYSKYIIKRLPIKFFLTKFFFFFWRYYLYFLEFLFFYYSKNVIFTTNKMFEFCKKIYPNKFRSKVISHGINLDNKKNLHTLYKSTEAVEILIIGSKFYLKGLDIAINSVKKLIKKGYKIKLNIVGFNDFHKYYHEKDNFIIYHGFVRPELVNNFYNRADFFISPSRYESFGLTIFESLSLNKPYIISEACENYSMDYNKYGIVVKDFKITSWEKAIIYMINNRDKYIKNIKSFNLESLSWKNVAEEYQKILK